MAYYLKWPADTGNDATNNKLCQLSGIATSGAINISLEFAENVVDPNTAGRAIYIYDGRRGLDVDFDSGNATYFLEEGNAITQNGVSNFKLNGVASNNTAWRTAVAGDKYSFDSIAQTDGVIAIGVRFNRISSFPLLALRSVTIIDGNGTHIVDMSSSGGTSNQFTSTDGVVTLKLFGFTGSDHWVQYGPQAPKNIWRRFPTGRITGSAFIPWSNTEPIVEDFFEALPSEGAVIAFSMPQMSVAVAASKTVPVRAATVSFAMPQMSVAVAASNAAAGVSASVAFAMPQMTVSAAASKTVPTYSATVAFSMPQMGVAVIASKAVPVRSATVSFTMPQMQVAATAGQESTNRSASIAFSMPQMQVVSYARSFALAAEADASFRCIVQDDANVFSGMLEIGAESIRFMIPDTDVYSGTIGGDASFNCIIATTAINYIGAIQ